MRKNLISILCIVIFTLAQERCTGQLSICPAFGIAKSYTVNVINNTNDIFSKTNNYASPVDIFLKNNDDLKALPFWGLELTYKYKNNLNIHLGINGGKTFSAADFEYQFLYYDLNSNLDTINREILNGRNFISSGNRYLQYYFGTSLKIYSKAGIKRKTEITLQSNFCLNQNTFTDYSSKFNVALYNKSNHLISELVDSFYSIKDFNCGAQFRLNLITSSLYNRRKIILSAIYNNNFSKLATFLYGVNYSPSKYIKSETQVKGNYFSLALGFPISITKTR